MAHQSTTQANAPTLLPLNTQKLGMWIFLASEVMFFGALIIVFLVNRFAGPPEVALEQAKLNIPLTAFNTFVLLTSSMTVVLALSAAQRDDRPRLRLWLVVSLLLGAMFLGVQMFEYSKLYQEGLTISSDLFGTIFFTLTGFHGTHVFIGLIWLLVVTILAFRGRFNSKAHMGLEIFGLYWHFVDIVWIALFVIVYLI